MCGYEWRDNLSTGCVGTITLFFIRANFRQCQHGSSS